MSGATIYVYVGNNPLMYGDPTGRNPAAIALPLAGGTAEGGFLASNPVGWLALAGSGGFLIGTEVYNSNQQAIDDWVWDTFGSTSPSGQYSSGKGDFWDGVQPWRGGTRTNGKSGKKRRYYEWDYTHGDIEEYDSDGRYCGSLDGETGDQTKPAVKGRRIDI